jgi:hypothetical protein
MVLVIGLIASTACGADGDGGGSSEGASRSATGSPSVAVGEAFCSDLLAYSDQLQEDVKNNDDVGSLVDAIQQTSRTAADILEQESTELPADAAFDARDVTDAIRTLGTETDILEITKDVKAIPGQISTFASQYC